MTPNSPLQLIEVCFGLVLVWVLVWMLVGMAWWHGMQP